MGKTTNLHRKTLRRGRQTGHPRYSLPVREFLRQNRIFVAALTLAAFALRLFFLLQFPYIAGDSFTYGDLAKNWMQHGIFGFTAANGPVPTLIRLPGYPAFLALIWSVAG